MDRRTVWLESAMRFLLVEKLSYSKELLQRLLKHNDQEINGKTAEHLREVVNTCEKLLDDVYDGEWGTPI